MLYAQAVQHGCNFQGNLDKFSYSLIASNIRGVVLMKHLFDNAGAVFCTIILVAIDSDD